MDESADNSSGERESQQGEAGKKLPVVWSPKLDAGEQMAQEFPQFDADEAASPSADKTAKAEPGASAAAPAPARSSRFALLAASVALAAALGSFVGSLSASGFAHLWPAAPPRSHIAEANAPQAMKAALAELYALKSSLDATSRGANSQFAKLADHLDRVERAGLEPATKIAHIADVIDRLEKRTAAAAAAAAPETTGSIAAGQPPATNAAKQPDKVLADWIVQGVEDGRALVESRYGGMFAVAPGNVLPGLGRVETIKRQDGEWIVVTARGIITSGR